jgi:hypothetical protein
VEKRAPINALQLESSFPLILVALPEAGRSGAEQSLSVAAFQRLRSFFSVNPFDGVEGGTKVDLTALPSEKFGILLE